MIRLDHARRLMLPGLALLVAAGTAYWAALPKTPRALFEKRCSTCHDLPDLSRYERHELAPLVQFMRTHNGAYRVISDAEAQTIIAYLENRWPLPPPEAPP